MTISRFPDKYMAYQPIINLASREVILFEALFRTGDAIQTQELCIEAEEQGWILELDLFSLAEVLKKLERSPHINVAVNLSLQSIAIGTSQILQLLDCHPKASERLCIELTETTPLEMAQVHQFLIQCRQRDIQIAQDDFGSGYSTEERARKVLPSIIKVVAPIEEDQLEGWAKNELVSAVDLANEIGAIILVERIESINAENLAMQYGAQAGQGYAYGRPRKYL